MAEAMCSFDVFTSLTKILYEAKNTFGMRVEPKALTIDFKNERTYKKLIEENFHKPK
jgi:fumarate reductase subunit C